MPADTEPGAVVEIGSVEGGLEQREGRWPVAPEHAQLREQLVARILSSALRRSRSTCCRSVVAPASPSAIRGAGQAQQHTWQGRQGRRLGDCVGQVGRGRRKVVPFLRASGGGGQPLSDPSVTGRLGEQQVAVDDVRVVAFGTQLARSPVQRGECVHGEVVEDSSGQQRLLEPEVRGDLEQPVRREGVGLPARIRRFHAGERAGPAELRAVTENGDCLRKPASLGSPFREQGAHPVTHDRGHVVREALERRRVRQDRGHEQGQAARSGQDRVDVVGARHRGVPSRPLRWPAPSRRVVAPARAGWSGRCELIKTLEPYVTGHTASYGDFATAVEKAVARRLPDLGGHLTEVTTYLAQYSAW